MRDRTRLDGRRRQDAITSMAGRVFDVVVIGGGVTGAGTALDAAGRGLSVALLEARDLASGTSSRSGKIFHGGLRYLEQLNFSLVREALTERDLMVARLCPHLAEPEAFLYPFTKHWERPYVGTGALLYDVLRLGGTRSVPAHRQLSRRGALRAMPALRSGVTGAVRLHDVRVDDARHTMTVARTAAAYGAEIVTRAAVVGLSRDGERVTGVRARDAETGRHFDVRARAVVNASGVWAEDVQGLAGEPSVTVTPAKGVHLVVPADRIPSSTGLIARAGDSVFIIRRWFGHWLMGTTDTRWDQSRDDPVATRADVDYLLGHANRWLRDPLSRDDVVGWYAGLRPLVSGRGTSTAALSRDHLVTEGPPGLVTVVGGKYTTYRLMARDAVDAAVARFDPRPPSSCTERLPLVGADGLPALRNSRSRLAAESGLSTAWIDHLVGRYGTRTSDLLDLAAEDPALRRPVPGAPGYLGAEFVYAASHEGALHLDDLLARRTRTAMEAGDGGRAAAAPVAELVAGILGWDDETRRDEVERYVREVAADEEAVDAPDDATAAAVRAAVRESQA